MQKVIVFLSFCFISISQYSLVADSNSHGAVHLFLPDGEEIIEESVPEMPGCRDCTRRHLRPWYSNQKFEAYDYEGDPTSELEYDTAWPSEREEFSDTLFQFLDRQ